MNRFVHAVDRLSIACAAVASVMLVVAALIICWNVIYRTLGASTYWEIEFSVYMMVASLFLASPYCLKTDGHVAVDLLSHYLPKNARRVLTAIVMVVGLAVCTYLAIAGAELAFDSFSRGERSESAWGPPKWPLFLTMPVGMALTALQYIAEMMRTKKTEAE